jgi:hypothetical protein
VWQCRYSGIEVPDGLWRYVEFGASKKYSDNQAEHMASDRGVMESFDAWTDAFAGHVASKGPVTPTRYRAYGYRPPSHFLADLKTKWRGFRMAIGRPVPGTSPAIQQERGLNRDATLAYKASTKRQR